jgi:hypothetical protein
MMQLLDSYLERYSAPHLSATLVPGKGNASNKVEVLILFRDEAVATIFQGHYVRDIVTLENETQNVGSQ